MNKRLEIDGRKLTVKELKEFLKDIPDDYIVTGGTMAEWDFGGSFNSVCVLEYEGRNMVNFTLLKLY